MPTSSGGNCNTAPQTAPYSVGQQDSSRLALQPSAAARAHSRPDASQQLGETTQPSLAALPVPSDTGLGDVGQPMAAWLPGAQSQMKAGLQAALGGAGAGGGLAAHRPLPLAYPQQAKPELPCTQHQLPGPKQQLQPQQHKQVQQRVAKKEGTPRPASGPRLGPAALDIGMQAQSTRPAALSRAVPQQTQQSSAPAAVANGGAASNGDVTEATVAAVAAAASAAAAAAAAAVVAAAGQQVQAHLQVGGRQRVKEFNRELVLRNPLACQNLVPHRIYIARHRVTSLYGSKRH